MIAAQRYHLTSLQSYFMLRVMADGKLRRYERMIATQRYHLTSLQSYSMLGVMAGGRSRRNIALFRTSNKKKKASDSTGLNGVYQKSFSLVCRYPALF